MCIINKHSYFYGSINIVWMSFDFATVVLTNWQKTNQVAQNRGEITEENISLNKNRDT